MIKYIGSLLLLFLIISCSKDQKNVDTSDLQVQVDFRRLDLEIGASKSVEDVNNVLTKNPGLVNSFIQFGIVPDQRFMANQFYQLSLKGHGLFQKVNQELGDVDTIKSEIRDAFKHFKYYDSKFKEPILYWVISGFGGFSVDAKDSLTVIIGSEYFLKQKDKYAPNRQELPYYLHQYFDRDHLVSKVTKRMVKGLYVEFDEADATLVNQMIYWGKVFYMTEYVLPTVQDSIIVEYSSEEMERVEANKKQTYNHFVANQLFFKEDHNSKLKYIDRRPHTNELGDNAPGRIGQYLGWEIVRSYMANNKVSLMELMKEKDHQKIFRKAKYKP